MKADMHAPISIFNATFHESFFHLRSLKPGILTVFTLDHPSALKLAARYKPNNPVRLGDLEHLAVTVTTVPLNEQQYVFVTH